MAFFAQIDNWFSRAASGVTSFFSDPAFKGGAISRLTRGWQPAHRSGDAAIRENGDLLLRRIRDLFRNEPTLKGACRTLGKCVVGTGIQTYASAMINRKELDDEWNIESDDEFERWSDDEADVEGRMSWPEMQLLHFKQVCESGESLLLKCSDDSPGRSLPLCYQLLEKEQLDWTKDFDSGEGANGNRIVRGVEYNSKNQAVAYWIYTNHPYDTWGFGMGSQSTRIPADRVIHTYLVERPSQHSGVTWFGANIQTAKDIDWYLGNELTAAALGSLLTMVVKRANGAGSGLGFGASDDDGDAACGSNRVKWGAGLVADIGKDDSVEVAESNRPNRDAAPFIKFLMMLSGQGIGMSYLRMTGDYSQSSYTSARAAHLDDQAFFVVLQNWFGRQVVKRVRRAHTVAAAAYGLYETITPRKFLTDQRKYLSFKVQAPGREQLDPERETDAALKRIDGLISTWEDECGLRGKNWRRIAIQQKRERDFFDELKLVPDLQVAAVPTATNPPGKTATDPAKKTPAKTATEKSEARELEEATERGDVEPEVNDV